METDLDDEPRTFTVGDYKLCDYGSIRLDTCEMVSLRNDYGQECDLTRREWGYYLGPSLNGRLREEGFRAALVLNPDGKIFINIVEPDRMDSFESYLNENDSRVLCWLDDWIPDTDINKAPNTGVDSE